MNEELRERLARLACHADGCVWDDEFHVPWDIYADQILAEIEAAGFEIVPKGSCECEDCYPELTAAAGKPLPEGVTTVTWGWGEKPDLEKLYSDLMEDQG